MSENLLDKLGSWTDNVKGRLTPHADMSRLTWFQVGGKADLLFQPNDEEDLAFFLKNLPSDIPVLVVGVGSNLLVRDGGISGVVIRLSAKGFGALEKIDDTCIRAGTALPDKRLAAFALEHGLDGFSFYHGIPGALGGALRMNAGANGSETKDRLLEAVAFDRKGCRHVLNKDDFGYTYRHSSLPDDLIFTQALFIGEKGEKADIQKAMEAVQNHRETVQPVREKTGGSTFKNPEGSSAWREIDAAGCRGLMVGGAQMSEMHCNFMINKDKASAYDLETLGETVRARVLKKSGVKLEWEIKRFGSFKEGKIVPGFIGEG